MQLIFISLKFEWMALFCVLLSSLQFHKLIVLQSLTHYFVRVSAQELSGICYMLILVNFLMLLQISLMQIYRYDIIVLNKWGSAWWVFWVLVYWLGAEAMWLEAAISLCFILNIYMLSMGKHMEQMRKGTVSQ